MTDIELDIYKKVIFSQHEMEDYKKKCCEISCINMINSYIAYQWRTLYSICTPEELLNTNCPYLTEYIEKLGRDRVIELIADQIADVDTVQIGVITDSEGLTYNSIKWKTYRTWESPLVDFLSNLNVVLLANKNEISQFIKDMRTIGLDFSVLNRIGKNELLVEYHNYKGITYWNDKDDIETAKIKAAEWFGEKYLTYEDIRFRQLGGAICTK